MNYYKMKWLDLALIVFLVLVSFLPNAVFAVQDQRKSGLSQEKYLVVMVDGIETERILLRAGGEQYQHAILSGTGQSNILQIDGDSVKMLAADCPDQVCIRSFPAISHDGEQIICLPHKVVVKIQGGEKPQGDLNAF